MLLADKLQNDPNETGLAGELLIPGQTIFWSVGAYLLLSLPSTRGFSRFFISQSILRPATGLARGGKPSLFSQWII